MTIDQFLRTLLPLIPRRKDEALQQIVGVFAFDGVGQPPMSEADRQKLVNAKVAIVAGRQLEIAK